MHALPCILLFVNLLFHAGLGVPGHAGGVPSGVLCPLAFLVNAVWQLPLLTAAALPAARVARRLGPAWVHRVWVQALVVAATLPVFAGADHALPWPALGLTPADGSVRAVTGPATAAPGHALVLAGWLAWVLFACWLAWTAAAVVRLVAGLAAVRRMGAYAAPLPAKERAALPAAWTQITIQVVPGLAGPVVVGVRRPRLLLPHGFLARAGGDARIALEHEMAHIVRRDYAKHLAMTLLALPLSWHPCMWLLRARVLESREIVCDAMAARTLRGGAEYARALLRLAALYPRAARGAPSLAAGMFDGRSLERRMTTMMHEQKQLKGAARAAALGALTLFAAGAAMATASTRMNVDAGTSAKPVALSVSSGVMESTILSRPAPVYPPEAKAAHQQGTVTLAAVISKQGDIEHLKVVHSAGRALDRSAIDAVRQWKYKPYLLNGDPVEVDTNINITYSLAK